MPVSGFAADASSDTKQLQQHEKQTQRHEKKIERTFSSLQKSLTTLEGYREQAIPQVPLRGQVLSAVPKELKLITVELETLQETALSQQQQQEFGQFRNRYETLKDFFHEKQSETPSPAHHHIRFLHKELYMLEQPSYTSSGFFPDRRLAMIESVGYRAARILEQDSSYPLTPLLKRIEPLAKEYVTTKQRLLEIQPGYRELGRAMALLHSAESLIGDQAPPGHKALTTNAGKAAAYIAAAKELAPEYFKPVQLEARLTRVLQYTGQDNTTETITQSTTGNTSAN